MGMSFHRSRMRLTPAAVDLLRIGYLDAVAVIIRVLGGFHPGEPVIFPCGLLCPGPFPGFLGHPRRDCFAGDCRLSLPPLHGGTEIFNPGAIRPVPTSRGSLPLDRARTRWRCLQSRLRRLVLRRRRLAIRIRERRFERPLHLDIDLDVVVVGLPVMHSRRCSQQGFGLRLHRRR